MKLRLKPTILPYQLAGEVVLQFAGQYARIPDRDGAMWELTRALDGSRTAEGVTDFVCAKYPGTDRNGVASMVDEFIKHRMVELPEDELTTSLSPELRSRFSRNFDFFGSLATFGENKYAYQERMLEARICVLGCGGLGTHILFDLAAVGAKHLTILDFDRIELSNLNRQILYKEADIGAIKVETTKRRLLEFNSGLEITTHHRRLESTGDIAAVVQGHDLVICIADKPANYIIEWLNAACVACRVPYISGGVDIRRSVYFSVQPRESGCVECWLTAARAKNPLDREVLGINKSQDVTHERPLPAFVPMVAVTAGLIVSEAVRYATRCQPPQLTNKLKEFAFDEMSINVAETWTRDPDCRICGRGAS